MLYIASPYIKADAAYPCKTKTPTDAGSYLKLYTNNSLLKCEVTTIYSIILMDYIPTYSSTISRFF